ncbi:MAG: transcriptional repressor [Croceitalea sp.]|nr:transcriptional repressor [Croceitalea sp.]
MENVNKILKEKAVRITPMRQLLLEYYLQHNKTFGLMELEKAFPKSDRITMYRTLKTFEEKGIIHSINNETGEVKYALCKEHCTSANHLDQHPHFHCSNCNQITCMESVFIPPIELPDGFSANEISMTIKGICKNCQA